MQLGSLAAVTMQDLDYTLPLSAAAQNPAVGHGSSRCGKIMVRSVVVVGWA